MMRTVIVAVLLTLVSVVSSDDDARLLASKNILNELLVEGKDLTVEYSIYNVGGSAALNVHLKDDSFPETEFEIVRGYLDVVWQRIAPGSNVSHIVVLRPAQSGYVNFTSAEITYQLSEEAGEPQFGYTSAPGKDGIVNLRDYDRKFSPHVLDWAAFAVMTLPSLGIPFILWYNSKSKYDTVKNKRN